ncbi:MAG: hypothetical protein LBE28_03815 [Providencia alcalifaciens]|jgi:hypothetical protein|nr:hypothetical protein [Providencia alcalifaciens]
MSANKNGEVEFIIRKMEPSLPSAMKASIHGPNVIFDFMGAYVNIGRREVFASIAMDKQMALDLRRSIDQYLEYLESDYNKVEDKQ